MTPDDESASRALKTARWREEVTAAARLAMSPARKERIWTMRGGICRECKEPVSMRGDAKVGLTVYDHLIPVWMDPKADVDANVWPLHPACDKPKTAKDATDRAKVKRLIAGPKKSKRPLKSQGFQTTLTRGFDGVTRRRKVRHGRDSGHDAGRDDGPRDRRI